MEHNWSKEVATVKLDDTVSPMFATVTNCLICGEPVAIDSYCVVPKICDNCRAAVMRVRRELEDA